MQWITKLPYHSDGLFDKLSSQAEGWRINDGEKDIDVPIGRLDETAYQILAKTIETNQHIAIALPRVRSGVSLSLIAYLVVNRFIQQHGRLLKDFLPISLNNGQSIIIATQNRKLRDFFLLSSLKFSSASFPFTFFPIYRTNNSGELTPLTSRNEAGGQININPIVFYHFDNLNSYPNSLNDGCLLGELVETNSSRLVDRLASFIEKVNIKSSLIIVNKYAENTLSILENKGYKIITFDNDDISKYLSSEDIPNLPSLNSSLKEFPKSITLKVHLIENKFIDSKLSEILKILQSLNAKITGDKPRILYQAWGVFYVLKDLCVPLFSYEMFRKRNAWLKTIKFSIQQIFEYPLSKLSETDRISLAPIWGTLQSNFTELYACFEKNNPKFEYIKDYFDKPQKTTLIFSSQGQTETFNRELLLNKSEDGENVDVCRYINDKINSSSTSPSIFLAGVWKKSEDSKILSLLPMEINLLCYGSELPALQPLINRINRHYQEIATEETKASLGLLELELSSNNNEIVNKDWITPDSDTKFFIDYSREFFTDNKPENIDENDDWLSAEIEDNEIDDPLENQNDSNEETVPALRILLENDKLIFLPTYQEVFAYTEDGEVQSKVASALEPGEIILLYSQEQSREMFESVIRRTQELSGVDTRVLEIWKIAMKTLRETYDIENPNSLKAYFHDLKDNHCEKTEQASKMWLRGATLAPRDQTDISILLGLVQTKNQQTLAKIIHKEIENIRVFHRVLGRRLKNRLEKAIRGSSSMQNSNSQPLDQEIDEILEKAEPVAIKEISEEVKYIQKSQVRVNVLG